MSLTSHEKLAQFWDNAKLSLVSRGIGEGGGNNLDVKDARGKTGRRQNTRELCAGDVYRTLDFYQGEL